jgi:hypothetical protein
MRLMCHGSLPPTWEDTMRASMTLGFVAVFAVIGIAAPARAQIFISATGDDDNNCGRTAPCRTLQRGIDATGAGRELTILNSGEYGPATINKSITILAEGVSANIRSFAAASDAITIDDPAAKVVLRGLFLTGGGTGASGIRILSAATVHIENCRIERFNYGIFYSGGGADLFVTDTISRENDNDGLYVSTATAQRLKVDNSQFDNNGNDGLSIHGVEAAIIRTVVAGNGTAGIRHSGGEANITWTTAADNGFYGYIVSSGKMRLEFSTARGNGPGNGTGSGFRVQGGAVGVISNSVVTDNDVGLQNFGSLLSRRNNTVAGNTTNISGTITTLTGV